MEGLSLWWYPMTVIHCLLLWALASHENHDNNSVELFIIALIFMYAWVYSCTRLCLEVE